MRDWFRANAERFRAWAANNQGETVERVELETKGRMARNELALFANSWTRFLVFGCALAVFLAILNYTTPPRSIKTALTGEESHSASQVDLCFGNDCFSKAKKNVHPVTLPFFDLQQFEDFDENSVNYGFRLNVDHAEFSKGLDTFFGPMVWGDADIYRSGIKIMSGVNLQPLVLLTSPTDEIVIRVKKPSGGKLGIRGTFAPVVIKGSLAQAIDIEIKTQEPRRVHSFVAQLSGLCLLLVMFLTFPFRPELFAFLIMFGVETLHAAMVFYREDGRVLIAVGADTALYNLLTVLGILAVVFFVATFFRKPLSGSSQAISKYTIPVVVGVGFGYVLLTSLFGSLSGENALFVSSWAMAVMLSFAVAKDSVVFLFVKRAYLRLALGLLTLAAIAYWGGANIRDHFVLTTAITSQYKNHLHFFFLMATVLGVEIGRTEIRVKEAFSLLPKEIVGMIQRKESAWREGFVVLLDVVGWSGKLMKLDENETAEFMKCVNEYLLSFFDEPGVSVCSGTGDGFFLTLEGKPTKASFERLVQCCCRLATERPRFEKLSPNLTKIMNEPIIVRSALGYGTYYLGFAQTRYLRKDFLGGFLPTQLARGIGSERDPKGPRILSCPTLDQYRGEGLLLIEEQKTDKVAYWNAA